MIFQSCSKSHRKSASMLFLPKWYRRSTSSWQRISPPMARAPWIAEATPASCRCWTGSPPMQWCHQTWVSIEDVNGDWIANATHPWNWELVNVYNHHRIPLPAILEFEATDKDFEFIDVDGQQVRLLKIAICEVPTTAGKYKDFSILAIFDSSIAALHGPYCSWTASTQSMGEDW